ncbi:hypothetical protein BDW69DRAFT_199216 [Aspergillus filifer]
MADYRTLKARDNSGKFTIDLAEWYNMQDGDAEYLFDVLYEQQTSYVSTIQDMQEKLAEYRNECDEVEQSSVSQLVDMEMKLRAQQQEESSLKSQIEELRKALASKDKMENELQGLNAKLREILIIKCKQHDESKKQIAELKVKMVDQEDQEKNHKADIAKLSDEISSQIQQLEADKARIAALEKEIQTQGMAYAKAASVAESATSLASTHPNRTFKDGVDPKFINWQFLMEMKFVQDAEHFNTPASPQDQLLTRLRSKAFEYLEMLYRDPELRTTDVRDFRFPGEADPFFWNYYRTFLWNAVKHELPEEEWSQKLHEYLQLKLDMDIGEFSTYEEGTSKEIAKQIYLRLLRQGWEDGEGIDKI